MKKKIIYLDRDGVINEDFGYVSKIENFKFVNGVFEACKEFLALGYEIIVVTNQSGIGRNYYSEDEFLELTKQLKSQLRKPTPVKPPQQKPTTSKKPVLRRKIRPS